MGDAKSSLGDAENSLGDARSSLGDAESSLGDAKSSLSDAKSFLGDAESSLGAAKSSLSDAKSFLGDAKSSLGDVQVGPSGKPYAALQSQMAGLRAENDEFRNAVLQLQRDRDQLIIRERELHVRHPRTAQNPRSVSSSLGWVTDERT
jgi:uncharacterized protein (DUF3084 family)